MQMQQVPQGYGYYDDEEDEEMDDEDISAAERELAEDAQWKIIQKNTFTRWANEHLKQANKDLSDLQVDLSDGLRLLSLIEVLSGKPFKHFNRRPNFRTQKLENVTQALKFLEEEEGIRLVNIDSTDIVDGKMKLILGLIWTLILHYSITMPVWEGEEELPHNEGGRGPTPRQRLLAWVNSKLPDYPVSNFTTDWNDGRALGALVDACGPGLCPDWDEWDPRKPLDNAREAMDNAEKWLDVPQLIRPEEIINPRVDEKAVMTYLSQFPNTRLKPGAPIRPKTNPARVRAYGPGLEPVGNTVGAPARFVLETFSAGRGNVEVIVLNPRGQIEPCEVVPQPNQMYACAYVPRVEGEYRVVIKFANGELPKSPYRVAVQGAAGDPSQVTAAGPGIERSGNQVGKRTYFQIYTQQAGPGITDCVVVDPRGNRDTVKPRLTPQADGVYLVEYTPKEEGPHTVQVLFAGQPIPGSPYPVMIDARSGPGAGAPARPKTNAWPAQAGDASRAFATGRGIQPKGVRVKDVADFVVHTEDAGPGELQVQVVGPAGEERCKVVPQSAQYLCSYVPQKVGPHTVNIQYAGAQIPRSPFRVEVGRPLDSKIRAFGPGLFGGVVNKPAAFTVQTNGEPVDGIGFTVEGPSEARIDCDDHQDGTVDVTYWPTQPGEYAVHVVANGEDIVNSPWMAQVQPTGPGAAPDVDFGKVRAEGPGLAPHGVQPNSNADFMVDTRAAGRAAPLSVVCFDGQSGAPIEVLTNDNRDGTFRCRYVPRKGGLYVVFVTYGGANVPGSPFHVDVAEAAKADRVRVFGPGLESAIRNQPTYFVCDAKLAGAGLAPLSVSVLDERKQPIAIQPQQNDDSSTTITYTPRSTGTFTAQVAYASQPVAGSPFSITVHPDVDVSKVYIEGLEPTVECGVEKEFDVITTGSPVKCRPSVVIKTPSGRFLEPEIEETVDGFAPRFVLNEPGEHAITVMYGGKPVQQSPALVTALAKPLQVQASSFVPDTRAALPVIHAPPPVSAPQKLQPGRVRVFGDGLSRGVTYRPNEFTIDTRESGPAPLGVRVEGPSEARIDCRDNGNGTCSCQYVVTEPGPYQIHVLFNDQPVEQSPFTAQIVPAGKENLDVSRVRVYGPGIQPNGVFAESVTEFIVDARAIEHVGDAKVKAVIVPPSGTRSTAIVDNKRDGTYKCSYTPIEKGANRIEVTYDGLPVPGSAFPVNVVGGCDPSRVRAFGPGLQGGFTHEPQVFTIETKGAGQSTLGLAIEGPSEAKMNCRDNRDGSCTVEYVPTKPGTYEVSVKFGERDIPGSPFSVPIRDRVDPSKCRAYGPGLEARGARAKKPAKFVVDASRAGQAPLDVTYADKFGSRRPADIRTHGDGMFDCVYYPESDGLHTIDVRYDGVPVTGSPFRVDVLPTVEPHRVLVSGDGVRPSGVLASLPTSFNIDPRNAGEADLEVQIRDPEGRSVKPTLAVNPDNTYTCSYTADDVGPYTVAVNYGGMPVLNSPFPVRVSPTGAAHKVFFTEQPRETVVLGEETVVTVNTAQAGVGAINCRIRQPNNSDADLEIEDNGDGTVSLYYTPRIPGTQTIEIKFGGQTIPQGRFQQKAVPTDMLDAGNEEFVHQAHMTRVQTSQFASAFYPVDFRLPISVDPTVIPDIRLLYAEVITPTNQHVPPTVIDNGDGTATIKYQPNERGMHELHVSYNGRPIPGSPFKFFVDSLGAGRVTAYGPGLSHGRCGHQCEFTLVTKEAGPGGLSIAVEGPSKAEIKCHDNKDGTCTVSYLPLIPGEYQVGIKFMDKHIAGSPFNAQIIGEARQRAQLSVGHGGSDISLKVTEQDIANLVATIRSPTGKEEPCVLKRMPNGHLGISFTPREVGEHLVNVYRAGKHIINSPFKIYVGENEIGNARNVKVYGSGLQGGMARQSNEFFVDTKDAGYGGLGLSIEGPSKADIDCRDLEDGRCLVTYTPMEPGTYVINVKYADQHVPGSPFMVRIGGEPSHLRLTHQVTRQREAVDVTQIGSTCELSLKLPGTSLADMEAYATAPSGSVERCDVTQIDASHYSVKFVPREMGVHTVDVKHRKRHIPGSPFQFTVGPITDGGAAKVRAVGHGLETATVNVPGEFMVYTREAGAGGLSIAVEGPSKAEIDFEDRRDGSCVVSYRVSEPGDYAVSIKFNDEHIPHSPFTVYVAPDAATVSANRLSSVLAFDQTVALGRPLAFTINYSMPNAKLRAVVEAPSGSEDEAIVQEIDRGQYAVRFIPKESGPHLIHVLLDERHIPGSPYRILVGKFDADPGMVHAVGDGLSRGVVGQKCKFLVNTVNAGSGALSVTVEGPSKVQLNCSEVDEGYEFSYMPTVPGDYNITIKYGGNFHIVGSPFRAHVTGSGMAMPSVFEESHLLVEATQKYGAPAPQGRLFVSNEVNAERLTVRGLGLKRAVAGRPSQFTVDASAGGNSMLTVGIVGPTGIPCEELNVKHVGRQQYNVTYTLRDRGQYTMLVKWGDQHVPNSPFTIDVV